MTGRRTLQFSKWNTSALPKGRGSNFASLPQPVLIICSLPGFDEFRVPFQELERNAPERTISLLRNVDLYSDDVRLLILTFAACWE